MIEIVGTIGFEATAQAVRDGLAASADAVDLYIDSAGGDVIESNAMSLALAEYAMAHPEKQYTCTLGSLCASAAANILAKLPAAYRVKAYKDTLIMYHSCSAFVEGNPQQLRDYSVMMEIVNEAVIRSLISKTNLDANEIKEAFSTGRELWLDGAKAAECGLVNELIDAAPKEITYSGAGGTGKVLALVAEYKRKHMEVKAMENEETKVVETVAETPIEEEIKEEVAEELETPPEVEETDWEAKCGELEAECGELKKELEALKALVAKYSPTAKPTTAAVKADWLSMVRELNAKHLPEADYAREYSTLKAAHLPEFEAFMKEHAKR